MAAAPTEGAAVESYPEDATTVYLRSQNERYAATSDAQMTYEQSTTRNMYGRRAEELADTLPPQALRLPHDRQPDLEVARRGQPGGRQGVPVQCLAHATPFFDDHVSRQHNHFKEMLKLFCDPDERLDIENAVGNPPPLEDPLYDTPRPHRRCATSSRPPDARRRPRPRRQQRRIDLESTYRDYSTQQWVYVTSSDDPGASVGFHVCGDPRVA